MTGKRFTVHIRWFNYDKTEGDIELKDNGQPILMSESIDDVQWIKTLLNELSEENEQLRHDATILIQSNQDYMKENEELKENCRNYNWYKEYKQLLNENEQLKSSDTITDLETEIMKLKTIIQQLTNDNTKQKKKLNTAMKENEELKCGNKNLKAILNDFINILNRLQSNPTDKQTLGVARDMLQNMGVDLE